MFYNNKIRLGHVECMLYGLSNLGEKATRSSYRFVLLQVFHFKTSVTNHIQHDIINNLFQIFSCRSEVISSSECRLRLLQWNQFRCATRRDLQRGVWQRERQHPPIWLSAHTWGWHCGWCHTAGSLTDGGSGVLRGEATRSPRAGAQWEIGWQDLFPIL